MAKTFKIGDHVSGNSESAEIAAHVEKQLMMDAMARLDQRWNTTSPDGSASASTLIRSAIDVVTTRGPFRLASLTHPYGEKNHLN